MKTTNQTPVEWLENIINNNSWNYMTIRERKKIIQQALEMEKEQIEKAKKEGYNFATSEAIKEIYKNYKQ